jgi:hypothetical protein
MLDFAGSMNSDEADSCRTSMNNSTVRVIRVNLQLMPPRAKIW